MMHMKSGSTVVDLGTGSGAYVYEAGRVIGPAGKIVAVDIDQDKLKLVADTAKMGGFIIDTLFADLEKKLLIPDYSADYVILANTLHQIENKEGLISECSRILSPVGEMLFVEWHKKSSFGPDKELILEKEHIVELLKRAGLKVVRELPAGDYHYAYLITH